MNEFKYTSRPYVSRVNLETLGKSFDTLEQGHKEAVKTASDLKTAIYNLQMDNSENGFKDQLISEIQKTIDDNTVYGNQYAALDDIIAKSGDIATDGRVSGRLKSYAAKKEFDNRLDKMNITEDMKTMYKELNPYEYTDGEFNETTNKYEEGKIWEAKDTPVDTVPISTIQQLALQIASKKEGGGNTVYFMDANGNYTTDAKKSIDGQIYKTVDTRYTILSKEKIAEAYKLAIDSIPGAEESLKQDYKLDNWKHNKLVTEDNPAPIDDATDENGYVLSYDKWLNNKINKFSKEAEVHNVDTKTTYHNVSSISSGRGGRGGQGRGLIGIHAQGNNGNNTPYVASAWTIEEYDPYGEYNQCRSSSIDAIRNYFKKYYPKADISTSDDQKIINFMKKYYDPNKTSEANVKKIFGAEALRDKKLAAQLGDVLNTYHNADVTINNIRSKMSNEDRELLDFSEQARTGNYTNNNKYGKQIIAYLNTIKKPVEYEIGADVMKDLIKQYGFRNEKDFTSLGFKVSTSGDNFKIIIPTNVKNQIPKFQSCIDKADDAAGGNLITGFTNMFGKVSSSNYRSNLYNVHNDSYSNTRGYGDRYYRNSDINPGNFYQSYLEKANNVKDKAGIRTLPRTIEAMPYGSAESLYIETSGAYAGVSTNEKIKLQKQADEHLINLFKTADLKTAMIYKPDGSYYKPVSNNNTIQKDINNAASNGWLSVNIAQKPNVGHGYTYFIKYKTKEDSDYETVMITNTTIEDDGFYTPQSDPAWRVKNDMQVQNGTGMPIHNLGVKFGSLGDTRIHTDVHNQKYIDLGDKNVVLSEQEAISLSIAYNELGSIKNKIYDIGNNASAINYYEQQINAIAIAIATITKTNLKDVQSNIETYLSE